MSTPLLRLLRSSRASGSALRPSSRTSASAKQLARLAAPIAGAATRRGFASTSSWQNAAPAATVGQSTQQVDPMTGESLGQRDIDPARLVVNQTKSPKPKPETATLSFGRTFTDHMLLVPWTAKDGWGTPTIEPYGPLNLDPSSTVLHYAPCLFEGMKAYKDKSGVARLFRPDKNMERMNKSAARLAFPTFTGDNVTELIKKLVDLDSDWIPTDPGTSLYIRPTMIGTQAGLGVGPSTDILLFVIMSPVGPYYKTGFKPVSLLASTKDVRAWPGGTGGFKLGSNYAAGVVPQMQAAALGYQQILWLFGEEHYLTEVGTMNLFAVFEKPDGTIELVTPPLRDTILPGVTRDSILALAREHADGSNALQGLGKNFIVTERDVSMREIKQGSEDGSLKEMFGSGTAAIVSPIELIGYDDAQVKVPCGADGLGDVARVMLREIVGRQTGQIESPWSVPV